MSETPDAEATILVEDYAAFDAEYEHDQLTQEFVNELIDKIILFGNAFTGKPLHVYQIPFARRIIHSVIVGDGDQITGLAARQSGKSQIVAWVVATLMVILPRLAKIYPDLLGKFQDGFWVGLFAPVEGQAETLFGRTVGFLTSEHALSILGDPEIDDITARNPGVTKGIMLKKSRSLMLMMTANPRANIESKTFHLVIIDECFPAETPILTSEGWVSIGDIVNGSRRDWIVATQDVNGLSWANVRTGYRTPRHTDLIRVDHEYGSVYATTNHPFMVNGKEVPAIDLTPGSVLSVVPGAPQSGSIQTDQATIPALLFKQVSSVLTKPLERGQRSGIDIRDAKENWSPPQGAGRKWSRADRATAETLGHPSQRLGSRACLPHWRTNQGRTADALQNRYRQSEEHDCGGDRRTLTWDDTPPKLRQAERPMAVESRVVSVEVLQQGSSEFDQFSDGADFVYTLEVDSESHTYIAGGILVGNCQDVVEHVITKCYAEDTPIWLPNGTTTTIQEVVAKELPVLSYDKAWDLRRRGGGRSRENRANPIDNSIGSLVGATPTEWMDNGVQEVWRVSLASGRFLEVTAAHRWVARERKGNTRPHWYETKDLRVGMNVPLPTGAEFWGDRLNQDDGYFIGQMLGDGCLTADSPVWCGMNDPALEFMSKYAEAHGTSMRVANIQSSGLHEVSFTKPGNGKNPLMRLLEGEGLRGLKSDQKRLVRTDYSREFYVGLAAGLFDSDGCVSGKTAVFSNVSEALVRQLSDVLLKLGIPNRVATRKNNGSYGENSKDLWEIFIRSREGIVRFSEEISLRVPNKKIALGLAVEFHAPRIGRTTRDHVGIHWDRITDISYVGEKQTYCVTVEPSNLLIVNGIVCGNSISPMMAYTAGTMVLTGTPNRSKGYFYKAIQLNKRIQTSRGSKKNHFQWDWREVAKVNKDYAKFIKKEMLRIGEDSEEFLMSYGCKWMLDRGMFITQTVFEDLGDKSMQIVKAWHQSPVVVGVDPARKADSTVVTVLWVDWDRPDEFGYFDHRVLNWLEIQGDDWENQYFEIVNFLASYDVLAVGVDSNGVGDAVAGRLKLLLPRAEIVPVTSSQVEQSRRYKHLQALIQRRRMGWPGHSKTKRLKVYQRFMQQMLDAEKQFSGQHFTVAAPDEVGAHDDHVDALAIAASMTLNLTLPEVSMSTSPFF